MTNFQRAHFTQNFVWNFNNSLQFSLGNRKSFILANENKNP
ncbi:hypothetical protein ADICYQ_0367 [Cyclobacterium qasimii M12-11B]|uniref:Uncharacterized protein n=1 Tax=Cyclobacterium qasimii M12-11B TaxID=641524 RepID=S7VMN1_9BACT|nr:hypothetical protein ADICYQ_0367 [Cyclobacterium qasimii M12-11B]